MIEDFEKKILEIFYKLNLGELLNKNPTHAVISRTYQKLTHSCWEATDNELLICMDGDETDLSGEMEYVCRYLVSEAIALNKEPKSTKFMNRFYFLHVLYYWGIGILVNSVWEGNSLAEFLGVGMSIGGYIHYVWFFFRWWKQKKAQIKRRVDEIKPIYIFSNIERFYLTASLKNMILEIFIAFEFGIQFIMVLSVVY